MAQAAGAVSPHREHTEVQRYVARVAPGVKKEGRVPGHDQRRWDGNILLILSLRWWMDETDEMEAGE